jgi:hypothetical protein
MVLRLVVAAVVDAPPRRTSNESWYNTARGGGGGGGGFVAEDTDGAVSKNSKLECAAIVALLGPLPP